MFVVTTNPANYGKTWTSPLWLGRDGVVWGATLPWKHGLWDTREEVEEFLINIPGTTLRFYDLVIMEDRREYRRFRFTNVYVMNNGKRTDIPDQELTLLYGSGTFGHMMDRVQSLGYVGKLGRYRIERLD